jgi:hypothetical protein
MPFFGQNNPKKGYFLAIFWQKYAKKVPFWRGIPAQLCRLYGWFSGGRG